MKRLKSVMLTVVAVVLLVGVAAFAADAAAELSTWQIAVATVAATVVGVPIVQFIKTKFLKDDATNTLLRMVTYGVAFILSIVVLSITGGLKEMSGNWALIFTEGSVVFTLMTLLYSKLAEKLQLSR